MRRVDAPGHAEWQAASGIVTIFLGVIRLPLFQSPFGVRKIVPLGRTFGVGQRLSFVRPVERHARHGVEHIRTHVTWPLVRFGSHDDHSVISYSAPLELNALTRKVFMGLNGSIGMNDIGRGNGDIESAMCPRVS